MTNSATALRTKLGVGGSLLSPPGSNPKVSKNSKKGVMSWVLHLSPAMESGYEMCPGRSAGCTAACLNFAGNPLYFKAKHAARKRKTVAFVKQRDDFLNLLALEIASGVLKAADAEMEPSFRLNGTSDVLWDQKKFTLYDWVSKKIGRGKAGQKIDIVNLFSDVQFYDYSAILRPAKLAPPSNYYIIFSEKEDNRANVLIAMAQGMNIASVFPKKNVPKVHLGRPVIDGDESDLRYLDPEGVVVGLKVKGKFGLADTTGFAHASA